MSDLPSLRDYQLAGISWLVTRLQKEKAVFLADDMGLGKSRQALAAAQQLKAKRVLIVCPAGARRVWLSEITRWIPSWSQDQRVVLFEPGTSLSHIQPYLTSKSKPLVLILAYDELSKKSSHVLTQITRQRWDVLILDEAHYLKNPSNRTIAVYGQRGSTSGLQSQADKVILLSGTPTPNHAGEFWQHYRTFWPNTLKHYHTTPLTQYQFEERFTRYRDTTFGRQITGSKNQGILREALKEKVLRRRKDEVLKELPPLQLQDVALDKVDLARMREAHREEYAKLVAALEKADDNQALHALRAPSSGTSSLRQELGRLKVAPTIAWVQERMESTGKLLIFAWHHSVIDDLRRGLVEFNPVVVTGETSPKARAEAIDLFQTKAPVRIFIGQVLAAGNAITLTAASEVIMVEPSWVPGENVQAIARAHRLGQRDSVLASFLYMPGTLDERIMRVFRRKASEIADLLGDLDANGNPTDLGPDHRRRPGDAVPPAATAFR